MNHAGALLRGGTQRRGLRAAPLSPSVGPAPRRPGDYAVPRAPHEARGSPWADSVRDEYAPEVAAAGERPGRRRSALAARNTARGPGRGSATRRGGRRPHLWARSLSGPCAFP